MSIASQNLVRYSSGETTVGILPNVQEAKAVRNRLKNTLQYRQVSCEITASDGTTLKAYMEPTSTVRFYLVLKHLGDKRSRSGSLTVNSDAPNWRNYLGFLQPAPVDFSLIYISL